MEEKPTVSGLEIYATICNDEYTKKIVDDAIHIYENIKDRDEKLDMRFSLYKRLLELFNAKAPTKKDVKRVLLLEMIIQKAYIAIFGRSRSDEDMTIFSGRLATALRELNMLPVQDYCILGDTCNTSCLIESLKNLDEVKLKLRCIRSIKRGS